MGFLSFLGVGREKPRPQNVVAVRFGADPDARARVDLATKFLDGLEADVLQFFQRFRLSYERDVVSPARIGTHAQLQAHSQFDSAMGTMLGMLDKDIVNIKTFLRIVMQDAASPDTGKPLSHQLNSEIAVFKADLIQGLKKAENSAVAGKLVGNSFLAQAEAFRAALVDHFLNLSALVKILYQLEQNT
jgi:hypothetical protein